MRIISNGKKIKGKIAKITLFASIGLMAIGGFSIFYGGFFAKAAPNLNEKYQYIDTNYSIPSSNVKFVDLNGSDSNPGTQALPFKSLQKAIDASADGGTVVMNSGIYRQGHVGVSRSLTIQAAPHAEVWLKGSRIVNNWTQDGSNWVSAGWAPDFCNTCTVNPDSTKEGMAAYPAQLFINEEPITQVATQAEVSAGKFYVDTANKKIYLGSDPASKIVEVSDSPRGLTVATSGSFRLLGINFAQYSPQQNFAKGGQAYNVGPSQIYIDSVSSALVENSVIVQSANGGLTFGSSKNVTIKNSGFYDNGGGSLALNQSSDIAINDNKFERGNSAGFNVDSCGNYCTVGNLKITHSENISIKNNFLTDTKAVGIWCDEGCINTNIINNFVSNHRRGAIMYEVSSKAIIAGNIVESSKYGIEVGGSDHVKIYNNTLSRNERDMRVYEDKRINGCNSYNNATKTCTSPENWSVSKGLSWNTTNVEMHNNIMSRSKRPDNTNSFSLFMALSAVQEDNSVVMSKDMFTSISNNAYFRDKEIGGGSFDTKIAEWYKDPASPLTYTLYDTVAAFNADTGFESNSLDEKGDHTNPNFVHEGATVNDVQSSNYNLTATSKAKNAGIALPSDVATVMGWTAGVPVDMGALNNPWMSMAADVTAPDVSITSPSNSATVSGSVNINATATDNVGVTKVEIMVDGSVVATLNSSPYAKTIDTTTLADGNHTISAKAYDAAGNTAVSTTVNITVKNADTTPPTISLNGLSEGQTVKGSINVSANASDNVSVTKVEFIVDGAVVKTLSSSPYSATIDTLNLSDGNHTVKAKAYDAAGNSAESTTVNIIVDNIDSVPPSVSLTSPTAAAQLKDSVNLTASATDNVAVAKVEFFYGTTKIGESTTLPYSVNWDTTKVTDGSYSLTAKATDTSGNTTTSSVVVVTVKNEKPVDPEVKDSFTILSTDKTSITVKLSDKCNELDSFESNPTVPASLSDKKIILAFGFKSSCSVAGGNVGVKFDLGKSYASYTNLKVYKTQVDGTVKDITNQVNFTDSTIDGVPKTVLSFSVNDGGQGDIDGLANSKITDPVFVTDVTSTDNGGGTNEPGDDNENGNPSVIAPNTGVAGVNGTAFAVLAIVSSLLVAAGIISAVKKQI